MKAPRYVIGLDGGGTKTSAELCDNAGNVLASSVGGPSNFQVMGVDPAARTIIDLVEMVCHSVGCSVQRVASVCAGLTGAGRPSDQLRMARGIRSEARRRGFNLRRVLVESDARIALEGAFSGGSGIIVIAGTGSIVFGKSARGTIHRGGGWGRIIGDEGSGYAIGRELFRAVAAELDGRGRKTKLKRLLAGKAGMRTQTDIVRALYKENFDVASVAPLVTQAADAGDSVARSIVRSAALDLVGVIRPVAHSLRQRSRRDLPIVFVGSVLSSGKSFLAAVRRTLKRVCPYLVVRTAEAAPVHGASLLALRRL